MHLSLLNTVTHSFQKWWWVPLPRIITPARSVFQPSLKPFYNYWSNVHYSKSIEFFRVTWAVLFTSRVFKLALQTGAWVVLILPNLESMPDSQVMLTGSKERWSTTRSRYFGAISSGPFIKATQFSTAFELTVIQVDYITLHGFGASWIDFHPFSF